jgi:crotonobetainyl-CoA:carnitine CoA-transferase CaiB-like acyl-CoA transferase
MALAVLRRRPWAPCTALSSTILAHSTATNPLTTSQTASLSTSPPPPPPSGPLTGYKVLDLGQVVAGNFCGGLLAYFGADVIKVEPPGRGDALRHLRDLDPTGTSLWWRSYGRNRRCITVDLHQEAGREVVRRLAGTVDVLVENFRPGVMEKWKLGPADLPKILIYTRISGYGQTGPKAPLPGYASVSEAYGGFRFVNGYPDRAPVRPNISLGDSLAGMHAAFGAVMALLARDAPRGATPGAGQVVDAAISESLFNMLEGAVTEYVASGAVRPPSGSTITGVVPSGTWKAANGVFVVVGGNGNSVYDRLMKAIGHGDMGIDNPDYATDAKRVERESEICGAIEKWIAAHTSEHVMRVLNDARVPAGPILSVADIVAEPQYQARGLFHVTAAPGGAGGEVTVPAMLPVLSETPGSTRWAGPELGQHTGEVLAEVLGMSETEIGALKATGAI